MAKTEILSANEIKNLSHKELRVYAQNLFGIANKRIARFQKSGLNNKLITNTLKVGKFYARGKNDTDLVQEVIRARQFIMKKTSTIKGYKSAIEKTKKALDLQDITSADVEYIWNIYQDLVNEYPELSFFSDIKYKFFSDLYKIRYNNPDEIKQHALELYNKIYEENRQNDDEGYGFWDFE